MLKKIYINSSFTLFRLFIESFFALWAVSRACRITTKSFLAPILFGAFFLSFRYIFKLKSEKPEIFTKHTSMVIRICGAFFTLLFLLAEFPSLTEGLTNRLFQLVVLAASGIGAFFLISAALSFMLCFAIPYTLTDKGKQIRHLPSFCFLACMLGWLPYFLYEYPAIMTPDSINQLEQVLHMIPYSNHHPWAHTMVIKAFYSIGYSLTGSPNASVAFFTLFQMVFMAGCAAWLIATLQKLHIPQILCCLIIAFYALIPYHGVFVVTIWKDVLFSGAFLLFSTALARICFFQDKKSYAVYAISGLMVCLFRSNGWYAFLFSLPFLLFAFRHSLRTMLPLHLVILFAALFIKIPVMNAYHVAQPDFVESICIPLQQTARVLCEDKALTQEQWESVHKVIDTTYIKELYDPGFADNMKELVRAGDPAYLTEHKGEYFMLWLSLGLKYPATYLQAYIGQTIGFWYPDVYYTVGDIDGIIANDTGVFSHPLIGGPFVVKTKEILQKLGDMLPLYGLLFSMGAMFWALICCIAIVFAKKQYSRLILFLPGLGLILTLLAATPVASEFRYAYSLAYTLPLYLILPFTGGYNTLDRKS